MMERAATCQKCNSSLLCLGNCETPVSSINVVQFDNILTGTLALLSPRSGTKLVFHTR